MKIDANPRGEPFVPLGPEWWRVVLTAWNRGPDVQTLGGMGVIAFEVIGMDMVYVNWDDHGTGQVIGGPVQNAPHISGTPAAWGSLLDGSYRAVEAVMQGIVEFEGRLEQLLPFTEGFELLVAVAQRYGGDFTPRRIQ